MGIEIDTNFVARFKPVYSKYIHGSIDSLDFDDYVILRMLSRDIVALKNNLGGLGPQMRAFLNGENLKTWNGMTTNSKRQILILEIDMARSTYQRLRHLLIELLLCAAKFDQIDWENTMEPLFD